ncbi:MAG: C39 family peptidase [Ardenticatenaceae bacterium]
MVLTYSGIKRDQVKLAKQMKTIPGVGTPGFQIRLLASRRLQVIYRRGELADLRSALSEGVPPIAMLDTGELPYWELATIHAVVLLAIDEKTVLLNDPDKEQAPIRVSLGDFELAWYEMGNLYALLKKKPLWKWFW